MKKTIKEFVENYVDDYYPEAEEGEVVGGVDTLVNIFCKNEKYKGEEKEVEKIVREMLSNDELELDEIEMVNPENDQKTIYVEVITVGGHTSADTEWKKVRKNQSSWEFPHPQNYKSFENFNEFQSELLKEMNEVDIEFYPLTISEVKKWKKWDDVLTFDIL